MRACAATLAVWLAACAAPGDDELAAGNRAAAHLDLQGARESFVAATQKAPRSARAQELLGNVQWALADLDGARAAWLAAVQLDPRTSTEAQLGLARIDSQRLDHAAALDRIEKVVDRAPNLANARVERALVLLRRSGEGDALLAMADLDWALKAHPDDAEALFAREAALLAQGKTDEARATCARLQKAHPETSLAAWANARLAAVQSRRADVILHLRQARQAADAGWRPERVREDPAFRFMWQDPDFSREF